DWPFFLSAAFRCTCSTMLRSPCPLWSFWHGSSKAFVSMCSPAPHWGVTAPADVNQEWKCNMPGQCSVCGHIVDFDPFLRCPMCGNSAEFPMTTWLRGNWLNNRRIHVHCDGCGRNAVLLKKDGPRHGWFIPLFAFFWWIWPIAWRVLLFCRPFRCTSCGKKKWLFQEGECAGVFRRGPCSSPRCLCQQPPG